ncbi:MFS transporter [Streptomyces sp. NPDC088194]|uniref:MFS transporter n=1 Tax=Streptomyces sp. NPDC088194 TaxID=3154931 RepID=UPI00344BE360
MNPPATPEKPDRPATSATPETPILTHPGFRLLWASGTISGLGSWLLVVALPFRVFQLTGSPAATGLTLALESLPALLIGPWAGALLDRRHLARAMWQADLASAAAVALILPAGGAGRLWLIYLAVLGESLATTVFRPAARALTPAVMGTGPELNAANSLTALTGSVLRLAAPPLGALLLAGPGITAVLLIDIASYLASACLIARLSRRIPAPVPAAARHPKAPTAHRTTPAERPAELRTDLRAGLRHVAATPLLRGPLLGNGVFLTANAALTVLLVPFVVGRLHAPGYAVGYLVSGLGAGYVIGSAVSRRALLALGIRRVLGATQLANAAAYFALFNAPTLPLAVAAAVLIGLPGSMLLISVETHVQRTAPPGMLARVGALFFAADSLAAVVGALGAPVLVAALGLPAALNAISAFALLAVPVTLTSLPAPTPRADPTPPPGPAPPPDRAPPPGKPLR